MSVLTLKKTLDWCKIQSRQQSL